MKQTICFFGIYDPVYSRNQVLAEGFRANGWKVLECRVDPKQFSGLKKYRRLFKLHRSLSVQPDLVLVAYPGQPVVWLARLLFPGSLIIFDAFTSLYDSNVFDRQLYSRFSPRAYRDWCLDWLGLHLADKIITDTLADAKYFVRHFKVLAAKISRIFVGTTIKPDENLGPAPALSNIFLVHFHGTFIPLQGIATIIATAKLLEGEAEIKFRIIGSGQESAKIEALVAELKPTNIEFLPRMSFTDLVDKIKTADLVLGIFGQTDKATRVIPNKVFEALALGKPVLTADSPAARELLTDQENVLFSKAGDSADLAAKILWLKENPVVRGKLSAGARALFNKQLNPKLLVAEFLVKLDNENRPHYSRT